MFNKSLTKVFPLRLLISTLATGTMALGFQQNAQALTFNFNFTEDTPAIYVTRVNQIGDVWSNYIHDDVTVNINVEVGALPSGYLGGARPSMVKVNYADVVQQLELDRLSDQDQSAVANLPTYQSSVGEISIARTINQTSDATGLVHTDTSATNLWLTRANAKALGIVSGNDTTVDAVIRLSDQVAWDFDPRNDIMSDRYDFAGTVYHELTHTLGFLSGVDVLDYNAKNGIFLSDDSYDYITSMDLFRYSEIVKGSGTIDWTVDTDTEYFSVDGGQSQLAEFTNGSAASANADNYQVSHFRDGTNSVMRPTLSKGERSLLTGLDLQVMDVIGWDRAAGSQTNYQNSTISYRSDGDSFDGALSWGGWSNTGYNYNFWQEDGFLASSTEESSNHQDVPEPGMLMGVGVIALLGLKSLKKCS